MIIIPDIHGRDFWKEVTAIEDEEFVFLGDYVDPYTYEGVPQHKGLDTLREVIEFKQANPERVTLLLGNHDLSYLDERMDACRYDEDREEQIRGLLTDNLSLFKLCHSVSIGGQTYLFSHAGILQDWIDDNQAVLPPMSLRDADEVLNRLFHTADIYPALSDASHYRGGRNFCGSCVWADIEEFIERIDDPVPEENQGIFQIFGHTQVIQPLLTDTFACLDTHRPYHLDSKGMLRVFKQQNI